LVDFENNGFESVFVCCI